MIQRKSILLGIGAIIIGIVSLVLAFIESGSIYKRKYFIDGIMFTFIGVCIIYTFVLKK